ncbi:MAG: TolC family protein [Planctomycetota bacterium]|jgi:outer membrane protein TolC
MRAKSTARFGPAALGWLAAVLIAVLPGLGGCEAPWQRIDRRTGELLAEANADLGPETEDPRLTYPSGEKPPKQASENLTEERPSTVNPTAEEMRFTPARDSDEVMQRLQEYSEVPPTAVEMDLNDALAYAIRHSREYRFAEEDFLLSALRLLSERHLWGPRVFNDLEVEIESIGDNGLYDSSLRLVNDLRVTQRLPYGGQVSAQLLAAATEDLHQRVAGENVQTAELIFAADVPLLRGAGMVARESLIQAERNVVYATREFERFRRDFLFDITTDFLNLVVLQQAIVNQERQVELFQDFEEREMALAEAGRTPPFEAAQSVQDTLFAIDRLNSQLEAFRLAKDRFKVRLGMPEERALIIRPTTPGLPTPEANLDEAVRAAMNYRLDLQNRRDRIDDARRTVNNARNDLLADLDLSADISIPTDDEKDRAGLDFDFEDLSFRAALALGLPIDREIERLNLRQAQVDLERSIREYERFRDTIAVDVRAAVRNIDRAEFSRQLQEQNVRTADRRLASINAAPDRADARDRSETADALLDAQNDYLRARRDVQVSILRYLLDSGQLRVNPDGSIRPLRDMPLHYGDPAESGPGILPQSVE